MRNIVLVLIVFFSSIVFANDLLDNSAQEMQQLDLMLQEVADTEELAVRKNLYRIEVLFFAQRRDDTTLAEQFPKDPGLPSTRFAREIEAAASSDKLQLLEVRRKLGLSKQYTVLLHTTWQQILEKNTPSYPMHISNDSLEGIIRVKTVRDVQIIADILFTTTSNDKYRLQQKWRVKKNKIYYFDHPKFGLLVIMYPVKAQST